MKLFNCVTLLSILACRVDFDETKVNTAPVILSLSITPAHYITTSSELFCTVDVFDADGDSLEVMHTWTDDSDNILSESSVLNPAVVQPTDEIRCTVSVNDGTDLI